MAVDYYLILGVDPSAGLEEIKHAYRRKALELHPDVHGLGAGPFLIVQEAYAVLSDPSQRRAHDQALAAARRVPVVEGPPSERLEPRSAPAESLIPHGPAYMQDVSLTRSFRTFAPSFEEIFERLWSNFTGEERPKSERLESLTIDVPIALEDALCGGQTGVLVPALLPCPACGGQGGIGPVECLRCGGDGEVVGEWPVSVSFPPGTPDNYAVTVPLDEVGIHNLYLTVRFRVV